MRKCLFLLLLSTLQIFSEEFIEKFFTEGRNFQPTSNEFIQKSGREFTSFPKLPSYINDNELFMRIRYSFANYRLYKGQFNQSQSKSAPIFHFAYPKGVNKEHVARTKFYSAINAASDIPVVYFSKGGLHVEVASVLFYREKNQWKKIVAENVEDAKALQIKKGTLAVTSKPAGMPIFLDGKSTGLLTPNYLQDILVGEHTIELRHRDFKTVTKKVTVIEDDYVSVSCTLSTIKKRLVITGAPIGAEVKVNGVAVGTMPLSISDLSEDAYEISIAKELYSTETFYIKSNAIGFDTLRISLKEQFGRLVLPMVEEGQWFVNREKVSAGEQQLPAGKHRIEYKSYGHFEEFDTVIAIKNGETKEPQFHFCRPEGDLEILPFPLHAEIVINGTSYGFGPQKITLPVGSYTILCKSDGYISHEVQRSLNRGEYAVVKAMLREKRAPIAQRIVEKRSYRKVVFTSSASKKRKKAELEGTYAVFDVGGTAINRTQSLSITEQLRDNHGRLGAEVLSAADMKRTFLNRGHFAVTVYNRDEAIKYGRILNVDFAVFGRVIRDSHSSEPYLITQTIDLKTLKVVSRSTKKWENESQNAEQVAYNGI